MGRLWIACAVAVSCLASVAIAQPLDVPDHAGDIPDGTPRVDAGVAAVFGKVEAGRTGDAVFGGELRLGLRFDRVAFVARYAGAMLNDFSDRHAPSPDAYLVRLGGDVRYSLWRDRMLAKTKHGTPIAIVRGDLWMGGGLGREQLFFAGAATQTRPDLSLSFGITQTTRPSREGNYHGAVTLGAELLFARAPTSRVDATPSGGIDHSFLVTLAVALGN